MAKRLVQIPEIAGRLGHKSIHVSIYSHPDLGVAGKVSWGVYKGPKSLMSLSQVTMGTDQPMKDWRDGLKLLEDMIAMARRQLEVLDPLDE